jgi:hypothetical protein
VTGERADEARERERRQLVQSPAVSLILGCIACQPPACLSACHIITVPFCTFDSRRLLSPLLLLLLLQLGGCVCVCADRRQEIKLAALTHTRRSRTHTCTMRRRGIQIIKEASLQWGRLPARVAEEFIQPKNCTVCSIYRRESRYVSVKLPGMQTEMRFCGQAVQ